ncbi:MAG: hypothetical protein MK137_06525 [Rickettsiales bacterium]|nr:hypothetical protein [Rickettsiales bacterium]
MKYSKAVAASLLLANPSAGFMPKNDRARHPRNAAGKANGLIPLATYKTMQARTSMSALRAMNQNEGEGHNPHAQRAFVDIIDDNMSSLAKSIRDRKIDPNMRFFAGNTILHLIALKSKDKSLDHEKYYNVLEQLKNRCAKLMAKNNAGHTALDYILFSEDSEFASRLRNAHKKQSRIPVSQRELNLKLHELAQKNPTLIEKRRAVELLKRGAYIHYRPQNSELSTFEMISQNWSDQNAKAFKDVINAHKFMCVLNKKIKTKNRTAEFHEDTWQKALRLFYSSDTSKGNHKGL